MERRYCNVCLTISTCKMLSTSTGLDLSVNTKHTHISPSKKFITTSLTSLHCSPHLKLHFFPKHQNFPMCFHSPAIISCISLTVQCHPESQSHHLIVSHGPGVKIQTDTSF